MRKSCRDEKFILDSWLVLVSTSVSVASEEATEMLPGAKPLTWNDDVSLRMPEGAKRSFQDAVHRFIKRKIAESVNL